MEKFDVINMSASALYEKYGKHGKKVHVVMDMVTGDIYAMERRSRGKRMRNLCELTLRGTWYFEAHRTIKDAIGFVCKSTALKRYGKKVVDATPVYSETDNPHYSCASPMKIYATPMLDWREALMKEKDIKKEKA